MAVHDPHVDLSRCLIGIYGTDKLRLIDFSPTLLSDFRNLVGTLWAKGIQREGILDTNARCFELKVHGSPWSSTSQSDALRVARTSRLILGILQFMHDQGWGVELSMATKSKSIHDTLFFTVLPKIPAKRAVMCCLAFSFNDKIRVTDGYPEVIQAVAQTIQQHWKKGLQDQSFYETESTYEFKLGSNHFKLGGSPWSSDFHDGSLVDMLIMHLMRALKDVGWTVYATVGLRYEAPAAGVPSYMSNRWILKKNHD